MKKRVLIFSLAYDPHIGGAEVALKEITNRITDVEFHMLTMNFGKNAPEEKVGTIFVHRVGKGGSYLSKILFAPRAALAARSLHRELHFDTLWAMMSYMIFPVVLLRALGVRVPYVLTLQEGDPWEHMFNRWFILPLRPLLAHGFRHARAITAISMYLAGWARRMGYRGHVALVPNGVDVERFARATLADIGKKVGETWLVTSSRLVKKNAVDDVLRALVLLPETVRFLILGSGPEEGPLKALAEELHVSERVRFIGHISHGKLPGYLKACDIFIRPSRSEGMGNSFIEALAAGLPIIGTQEGGIADFLFDARRNPDKPTTGWAVDKNSPEQIAEAVKDILADPEKVARVRENAAALVREKYDWNLIAGQVDTAFNNLFPSY